MTKGLRKSSKAKNFLKSFWKIGELKIIKTQTLLKLIPKYKND